MILDLSNDKNFRANPYRVYADLRANAPVVPVEGAPTFFSDAPAVFISRYEDAVSILKDKRFTVDSRKVRDGRDLSKSWWVPNVFRAFMNSMVMVDEPDHTRLRGLVHKAFTPKRIQDLHYDIEDISYNLLAKAASKKEIDLIADFALPLPLTVISEMMGVPEDSRHKFHEMMQIFLGETNSWGILGRVQQFQNGFGLHNFLKDLIKERRKNPQDDLISALCEAEEAGDKLSEDELIAMLLLLLFAGHETTVNLIGNGMLALLQHPEQFEKLKANPDLLDCAIEEILRYTNPVQQIAPRYALEDVELHGTVIERGTAVMVGIASANHDAAAFENACQFDITRDPNRHIAFGFGIHYCLGAPLARMEAQNAFRALLDCYPDIRLATCADTLKWRGLPSLRGLRELPVCLNI